MTKRKIQRLLQKLNEKSKSLQVEVRVAVVMKRKVKRVRQANSLNNQIKRLKPRKEAVAVEAVQRKILKRRKDRKRRNKIKNDVRTVRAAVVHHQVKVLNHKSERFLKRNDPDPQVLRVSLSFYQNTFTSFTFIKISMKITSPC